MSALDQQRPAWLRPAPGSGPFRTLADGQVSQVRVMARDGSHDELVLQDRSLVEAPNWTPDGAALVVNGGGTMFRLPLSRPALYPIPVEGAEDSNNDHVLSPDGRTIYGSAGGFVYSVPVDGGRAMRLSPVGDRAYFLHGVSPDGTMLACTTIDPPEAAERWAIRLVPATGGAVTTVLSSAVPVDGPEWTKDGAWIWFNGEMGATRAGHARLFRVRPDGSGLEQMTNSARVDWFAHVSPDDREVVFLSYPPGTEGHPPNRDVELRRMPAQGGDATTLAKLHGGQGTMNVNSWSPDGRHFAYVAYPYGSACDNDRGE